MQDSTYADGVPNVALTADERGALRNYICLELTGAGEMLFGDSYHAVENGWPDAVEGVTRALARIREMSDQLERFGWDPQADTMLVLDDAGRALLRDAAADAGSGDPDSPSSHPDDVRGWRAVIALGERVEGGEL